MLARMQAGAGNRATSRTLARLKIGGANQTIGLLASNLSGRYGGDSFGKLRSTLTEMGDTDFADEDALHFELEKRGFVKQEPKPAAPVAPVKKEPTWAEISAERKKKVDWIFPLVPDADIRPGGKRWSAHLIDGGDRQAGLYGNEVPGKLRNLGYAAYRYDGKNEWGEDTFFVSYGRKQTIGFSTKDGKRLTVFHVGPGG
jgi:hypothetical protein